ncbi:uncharacterized protein PG998_011424 [Apiospora kogelbergensis]|uniref:uncharacterized protein n=1 Tax=Apiospora kogelbergensis TaxID=1337665 RepID=UPI003130048D
MCVIEYHMCNTCQLGYPGHTLYCEYFRPPFLACPRSMIFSFKIVAPEQCWLFPEHVRLDYGEFGFVDTYDANGQYSAAAAPADNSTSGIASSVASARSAAINSTRGSTGERTSSSRAAAPWPATCTSRHQQHPLYTSTGLSIIAPRISRQASPLTRSHTASSLESLRSAAKSPAVNQLHSEASLDLAATTSSPQEKAVSDSGIDRTLEFVSQQHRIDEALSSYRGAGANAPGTDKGKEREGSAASSVFGQSSRAAAASASILDPSKAPFYPQGRPGTPNSWSGPLMQDKGKGNAKRKKKSKASSSVSDISSRPPSRPRTPDVPGTPAHSQDNDVRTPTTPVLGSSSATGAQGATLPSPALSTVPAPQPETGSPSVQSLAPTAESSESEFPSLKKAAAKPPSTPAASRSRRTEMTPSSDRPPKPIMRSWATVAHGSEHEEQQMSLLPPMSTLKAHEVVTPAPSFKKDSGTKQKQQKEDSASSKKPKASNQASRQGSVTIGRAYFTEPSGSPVPASTTTKKTPETPRASITDGSLKPGASSSSAVEKKEDSNEPVAEAAVTLNKPKRSYSAALTNNSGGSAKSSNIAPRSASDDWAAPPPSWGRGRRPSRGG